MSVRVHDIPNRKTWREGKRIRRKTLANITRLPQPAIDAVRAALNGGGAAFGPATPRRSGAPCVLFP